MESDQTEKWKAACESQIYSEWVGGIQTLHDSVNRKHIATDWIWGMMLSSMGPEKVFLSKFCSICGAYFDDCPADSVFTVELFLVSMYVLKVPGNGFVFGTRARSGWASERGKGSGMSAGVVVIVGMKGICKYCATANYIGGLRLVTLIML